MSLPIPLRTTPHTSPVSNAQHDLLFHAAPACMIRSYPTISRESLGQDMKVCIVLCFKRARELSQPLIFNSKIT